MGGWRLTSRPTSEAVPCVEAIGHAVEVRVLRWLRRRGLLDAESAISPAPLHRVARSLPGASTFTPGCPSACSRMAASCIAKKPRGHQSHRVMKPRPSFRPDSGPSSRPRAIRSCALTAYSPRIRFSDATWWPWSMATCLPAMRPRPEPAAKGSAGDPDSRSDAPASPQGAVERGGPAALGAGGQAAIPAPHEITAAHNTRIDRATLLKRVHDIDALGCPGGGPTYGARRGEASWTAD